jgi:hypothetical protein
MTSDVSSVARGGSSKASRSTVSAASQFTEHQAGRSQDATLVQEERPYTCPHVHQRPSHC